MSCYIDRRTAADFRTGAAHDSYDVGRVLTGGVRKTRKGGQKPSLSILTAKRTHPYQSGVQTALDLHSCLLTSTPAVLTSVFILKPHPPVRPAFDSLRSLQLKNGGRGRESNPPIPAKRRQTGFEDLQGHRALSPSV